MAQYPVENYTPRTKENKPGVVYDPDNPYITFAEDVAKLDDEVVAIETELGQEPKGIFSDVNERLDDVDQQIITIEESKLNNNCWASLAACAYASADSPTFVMNITGDYTGIIQVGDRIKLTQTTAKYFIVTAVGAYAGGVTPVTMYGGTDYTLANATITLPYYSKVKSPQGFPMNPLKWTVRITDTSQRSQGSAVNGTWYNLGSKSISVPIGAWELSYAVMTTQTGSSGAMSGKTTLSTGNNSESDKQMSSRWWNQGAVTQAPEYVSQRRKKILVAAKTEYYINTMYDTGTGTTTIYNQNHITDLVIEAECKYL